MKSIALTSVSAFHAVDLVETQVLLREYAASLQNIPCFEGFDDEIAALPGEYATPRGTLLLVRVDNLVAGCCGLRPLDTCDYANASEMKRLYVRPVFRGLGLGRMLAKKVLSEAQLAGYACTLLDTLDDMEAARSLYDDLGFKEIPPYYHNPLAGAHYLKVDL